MTPAHPGLPAVGGALLFAALAGGAVAQTPQPSQSPPSQLNTLTEVGAALRHCWVPPPLEQSRPGMQITVLVTFRRNGEVFGQPRITFESPGATDDDRLAYRLAVADMIKRCARLPITDALGNAIAGRPFAVRFIDQRKLKQAESAL
jgi:hypothetical protein